MAFTYEAPIDFSLAFIDNFAIDCLISDNHTFESEVTEFPVESGSTISDNIRPKPITIVMECIVSNTPLENASRFRKDGSVPTEDAYAMLQKIRTDRRLVTISTSLQDYTNMAMESLSIPRASGRGDELRFSATFKQVQIVTNVRGKRVAIPAAQDGGANSFAVVSDVSTGYKYLDIGNKSWYDDAIAAWRFSAQFDTRYPSFRKPNPLIPPPTPSTTPERTYLKWLLFKGRPIDLSVKLWNSLSEAQVTDASLRARMIALQGGKPKPFLLKKEPLVNINMLKPERYVVIGLKKQF